MFQNKNIIVKIAILVAVFIILVITLHTYKMNSKQLTSKQEEIVSDHEADIIEPIDDTEDGAVVERKHIDTETDERVIKGIEVLETSSACYDTSAESDYLYTGVPQVDNCIHVLCGTKEPTLVEDYDDTINDISVHMYVVCINDLVYTIVYYPEVEALALPMNMTLAEYNSGKESQITDASAVEE